MRVHSTYQCEICGTKFGSEEEAVACEASGFPEPMPFLEWGCPIPAFGPTGVVYVNNSALKGGALWLSFRLFHFPASSRCPKAARTLSRLNRWFPTAFQYFRGIDLQILNHNRAVPWLLA